MLLLLFACGSESTLNALDRAVEDNNPGWTDTEQPAETDEATVVINELMAANDSVSMDEAGDLDDWVELYNASEATVDLGGWGLSDNPDAEASWRFPEGYSLGPGDRLVVWLDDEPEEGDLHATFSLDRDEDAVALYAPGEDTPTDALAFEDLGADLVLGRFPDGSAHVDTSIHATPENANPWDPGLSKDPSDLIFRSDEVVRIDLWLPDASWAALDADPYTYVEGALGFGGAWLAPVGIRVKGQWGSLRGLDQKAAFKVNIDKYMDGGRLRGLEGLTLNNMVQDPSGVHERLAYALFRDAGVPAPRTGHAALYLNGEYRGLYANIETVDDTFLARWFDDPDGNLYEGAYGQDLTSGSYTSLEQDRQGEDDVAAYEDLAVLAALLDEEPSEERVRELEALVDLDRALRMWAVEVLIGHWDGYFYYPNNYRVYHDPSTGLLTLLPWGTDQTFSWTGGIYSAAGTLAEWCLEIPSVRERYQLALWDAADRMRALGLEEDAALTYALIEPYLEDDPYKEASMDTSWYYYQVTLDFLAAYPDMVVEQIFPDGEPALE